MGPRGSTHSSRWSSTLIQSSLPLHSGPTDAGASQIVGVLSDVLGWTGSPMARTLESRAARREQDTDFAQRTTGHDRTGMIDLGPYVTGGQAGVRGLEASWESDLRGRRGRRIIRRDTDESSAIEAAPGMDVRLTIDAMLQARVQAAMSPGLGLARVQAWHGNHALPSGTPLSGAAVVLDVDTGEVLAMVSTPAATPAERRRAEARAMRRERDWIRARDAAAERGEPPPAERYDSWRDPDAMLQFNRAVGVPYPPGSIAKVVVLLEAVRSGAYSITERIACTGHLVAERPDMLRCWIFKRYATTHNATYRHDLSAAEALTASCNVFFYTLGRRLGAEGIAEAYSRWGVGTAYNLGVGPAARGQIEPRTIQQAILLGIGQGRSPGPRCTPPTRWPPSREGRLPVASPPTPQRARTWASTLTPIAAVIEGLTARARQHPRHRTPITFTVAPTDAPPAILPATARSASRSSTSPACIVGKTGTATAGPSSRRADGAPILDDEGEGGEGHPRPLVVRRARRARDRAIGRSIPLHNRRHDGARRKRRQVSGRSATRSSTPSSPRVTSRPPATAASVWAQAVTRVLARLPEIIRGTSSPDRPTAVLRLRNTGWLTSSPPRCSPSSGSSPSTSPTEGPRRPPGSPPSPRSSSSLR